MCVCVCIYICVCVYVCVYVCHVSVRAPAAVLVQMKGIAKQGVRCRDCGISCHKHCKDHVVVDCNKRKARKCECL